MMHPTQIWRSDPSRGYTWLALSNDSTCSHQLDTHSAGQCNDWYDRCRQMLKSGCPVGGMKCQVLKHAEGRLRLHKTLQSRTHFYPPLTASNASLQQL